MKAQLPSQNVDEFLQSIYNSELDFGAFFEALYLQKNSNLLEACKNDITTRQASFCSNIYRLIGVNFTGHSINQQDTELQSAIEKVYLATGDYVKYSPQKDSLLQKIPGMQTISYLKNEWINRSERQKQLTQAIDELKNMINARIEKKTQDRINQAYIEKTNRLPQYDAMNPIESLANLSFHQSSLPKSTLTAEQILANRTQAPQHRPPTKEELTDEEKLPTGVLYGPRSRGSLGFFIIYSQGDKRRGQVLDQRTARITSPSEVFRY